MVSDFCGLSFIIIVAVEINFEGKERGEAGEGRMQKRIKYSPSLARGQIIKYNTANYSERTRQPRKLIVREDGVVRISERVRYVIRV